MKILNDSVTLTFGIPRDGVVKLINGRFMNTIEQANTLLNLINCQAEEKTIANSYSQLMGIEPDVVSRAKILVKEARSNFQNGDLLIDKLLKINAKYF
jgi:hypothetical protein